MSAVAWLGDTALVVEVDDVSAAHRLAATVDRCRRMGRSPAGMVDTVVGFRSLVVHLDPRAERPDLVAQWLTRLVAGGDPRWRIGVGRSTTGRPPTRRRVDATSTSR